MNFVSDKLIAVVTSFYDGAESDVTHLQSRIGGISGDSTLVVSVTGHHNIATHSPAFAPAVSGREN